MSMCVNESGTIKSLTMEQGGGLNLSGIDDLGKYDFTTGNIEIDPLDNIDKYKFLLIIGYGKGTAVNYVQTIGNTVIVDMDDLTDTAYTQDFTFYGNAYNLRVYRLQNGIKLSCTTKSNLYIRLLGIY